MNCILQFLFSPLPTPAIIGLFTFGAGVLCWLITRPKPIIPPVDLNKQTVGTKDGARRSALLRDDTLMSYYYDDARTLYDGFQRGLQVSGDGPCLGYRKPNQPYQWLSYKQVSDRAEYLGSALIHRGLKASPEQLVGIFAQNRPEWIIAEYACYTYSMVVVPLYDTLGPEALVFIINKADLSTVICDRPDRAHVLLSNCEKSLTPVLNTIILMDPFNTELKERGAKCGVEILSLQEAEVLGKENWRKPILPQPEDLSVVCFTSGTTGDPKGAMLTHENVIADAAAFIKSFESTFGPVPEDISISFLPLAHMFERVVQTVMYNSGARVGFFQGDIRLLPDDMKALRPTVFPVVPRLLNRVYDKVHFTSFKTILTVLFSLKGTMGGRVRVMVTGAAPISPTVLNFLRAALGCPIFEAYGQTECTAGCTFSMPGDWTSGHVGPPVTCNIVKLSNVEEMNYFASNGEGEVCIKGKNVFKGYLKDPEKTMEALDENGWLHTGDIGKWLPSGVLKIIDRKKNIFKLAQGEYIAPEKIENVYVRSGPVAQVFVHGDSLKSCLVGIVVPDPEVLPDFAAKRGIKGSFEDLCKNNDIKKAIQEDMLKLGKESGLHSFEQIKNLHLHPEQFTIENGLLTPTLKAKRAELTKVFKAEIEKLYVSLQ
ncbi:long-chain-fatty-acid--CoA ligase 5-like [Polyodon spathula]|uniref:long-chain-fatty-acid--CoA ligase 5-like n=1 Tax=Polyodon spathula TaxID=7913 RepID=UPI001B7DC368|nr:long-chain-fatty-acid--CoA ligase 5-like [Polyodon spathula]